MGYGVQMRKVLDESLPMGRRYLSLREAMTDYSPLGYTASWAYVTAEARPDGYIQYDAAALMRAAGIIQASRAIRVTEMRELAARRAVEKRNGQRQLRAADRALFQPRWPGGATRLGLVAAVSAVNRDSRRQDEPVLNACAATYIARLGYLTPDERQELVQALDTFKWNRFADLLRYAITTDGDRNA